MTTKKNKNTTKKIAVVSAALAGLYYMYNRAKISIKNIDIKQRFVAYEVTLGFKTIAGIATDQTQQTHSFGNKTLKVTSLKNSLIAFKIVNQEGKQLDYAEISLQPQVKESIAFSPTKVIE